VFALNQWLQERIDYEWDRQFEQDVASGRLDAAAQKAIEDHRAGNSTDRIRAYSFVISLNILEKRS
jgi:hypothetical protein